MIPSFDTLRSGPRAVITSAIVGIMFLGYSFTVNPTVTFVDCGELASVAVMLGIAHPTGYPLFTTLGRLVTMVIPGEPVTVLNLFSSFLVACSVGLFYNILLEIRQSPLFGSRRKETGRGFGISAAAGALMFGFSTTVWAQSVALEVYSLHLFLTLMFLFLFLKGMRDLAAGTPSRIFVLSFFVWGLGFANHMTTILLIPACVYLYGSVFGMRRDAFSALVRVSPFFALGLTFYVFLPVRSSSHPLLDWEIGRAHV